MSVSTSISVRGALRGKTLARVLFDDALRRHAAGLAGRALDLASGANPSYLPLLPPALEVVRTDRKEAPDVRAVDIDAKLPFGDGSFDAVFLFNALYIAEDPEMLAREVLRVLKPGGTWFVLSPFIANEMPEPHDYLRFTEEGLERLCKRAGFAEVRIERLGERASAAAHLMHPFFFFNIVRALIFPLALLFDHLIPSRVRREHPAPLSYWCTAEK